MSDPIKNSFCRLDAPPETDRPAGQVIERVVEALAADCHRPECFKHVSPAPIPSVHACASLIETARRILFPGYFLDRTLDPYQLRYHLGQEVTELFQNLATQIMAANRHECFRRELECMHCREFGHNSAAAFIEHLPELRNKLALDVQAAYEGDPASHSHDQIIYSYPGLYAVTVYRVAHFLYHQNVPLLPRIMTEHAHNHTGIDIHPGAEIGQKFFIDHGTGVVVGQTAVVGDRVRLYQGVTLGALSLARNAIESLKTKKRHPTIEDDVVIYSGATILGGETVIGAGSVIGGNVWLTESVPPGTTVLLKTPELVFRNREG
jgi:serine O-acetyltransferase